MKFVCCLYGASKCKHLNELRCQMADKGYQAKKLPPTKDSFGLHLLRCLYQVYVWKQTLVKMLVLPPPTDFGYQKDQDGLLVPKMTSQELAAPELLNDIVCDCSTDPCQSNCSCFCHSQPCTTACTCEGMPQDIATEEYCMNTLTIDAYSFEENTDMD